MQQDIIITAMRIYDADLVIETGIDLFKRLFKKADDYDDILIGYGAIPYSVEE